MRNINAFLFLGIATSACLITLAHIVLSGLSNQDYEYSFCFPIIESNISVAANTLEHDFNCLYLNYDE